VPEPPAEPGSERDSPWFQGALPSTSLTAAISDRLLPAHCSVAWRRTTGPHLGGGRGGQGCGSIDW